MLYSHKNTALPWHIRETNCIDYRTRAHPRMVFTKSKTTCYLGSCLSIQHSGAQVRSWFGGSRGPVVGLLQASLSFSGPQIIPKLMSRSTNIQQNSLRSGGSTSPGVGMRLIWQIVTGTVGEALKSGMVINVNPRRVPLSANSFTPYTQLRNLPKFSTLYYFHPTLIATPDVNRGRLRYSGIASTKGFQRGQHLRGLLQLMALRITGVLPPILPAKTHTGASRRSWQFVLFQQDFIVILQRRGPLFFHAAR